MVFDVLVSALQDLEDENSKRHFIHVRKVLG